MKSEKRLREREKRKEKEKVSIVACASSGGTSLTFACASRISTCSWRNPEDENLASQLPDSRLCVLHLILLLKES